MASSFYFDQSTDPEYYFLFSHGFAETNLPRYELRNLVTKLHGSFPGPGMHGHNENGSWIRPEKELRDEHLLEMTRLSGYLQYGGRTVIRAPWAMVDEAALARAIDAYRRQRQRDRPLELVLLANTVEGFKDVWPYRLPGVTGSRFYRDKYFFQDKPVAVVLRRMDPPRGDAEGPWASLHVKVIDSRAHLERFSRDPGKDLCCLYLFQDWARTVPQGEGRRYPGSDLETQLVLIESRYSAKNMVHLFDDDKPFWPERHTTPPRLVAAAMNLSQIPLHADGDAGTGGYRILDPFVGTGTTLLEALKYPVTVVGNDLEPPRGILDNLAFFTDDSAEKIDDLVKLVERHLVDPRDPFLAELMHIVDAYYGGEPYFRDTVSVSAFVDLIFSREHREILNDRDIRAPLTVFKAIDRFAASRQPWIADGDLRFLLYQVYRVLKQRYPDCIFSNHSIDHALFGQIYRRQWSPEQDQDVTIEDHFRSKLELLSKQRAAVAHRWPPAGSAPIPWTYALHLRQGVPYQPFAHRFVPPLALLCEDVLQLAERPDLERWMGPIDLIFSDLPYSMNTPVADVSALYRAFFRLAARVLRPAGELILVVLDKVRSGRLVPQEAFPPAVVAMMTECFAAAGRRAPIQMSGDLEDESREGVLYWKSTKALNRVILHYRTP